MKIKFLGAAKTVTGSCYYLETKHSKFLVDCGMFQGHTKEIDVNSKPFPFNPADLDFILLTHAHIDHSGRIPKIYLDGFRGEVISTKATVDLCGLMLPDSGHIQEFENEWTNRKRTRAGLAPIKPLYTFQDAVDSMRLFRSVSYDTEVKINDEIRVKFNDAGHILGSSIIEIWVNEDSKETKIVFSGDLGNKDIPILRDVTPIESADYLIIESTYGNRIHKEKINKVDRFVEIITETIKRNGNVVIPSFAVGRTQEIIYDLHKRRGKYDEKIKKLFSIPVIIDSPLAISATEVFRKNLDCFDDEAREYIENGDNPLDFPGLQFTRTSDESRELNDRKDNMIIISASGMCDAGRIKHHLKHNLWRKESTILFVGYQAVGTLGRKLVDGAKTVKIFGEEISVNAHIEVIEGFSGHADKDGLIEWISKFAAKPKKIFIVHGEEEGMNEFSDTIKHEFNIETIIPGKGDSYNVSVVSGVDIIGEPAAVRSLNKVKILEMLKKLRSEFDDVTDTLKSDVEQGKDENELSTTLDKLKAVERVLLESIK
jgi:metallo-beta-lactamase family protein